MYKKFNNVFESLKYLLCCLLTVSRSLIVFLSLIRRSCAILSTHCPAGVCSARVCKRESIMDEARRGERERKLPSG